ncbi:uncharacterized protein (TIGR03083 family) [Mumia flava]|uniref:Uncharacterized protein (TIGR03083 family) n=1 Tax=Mumia flava TaxID=1348852 RepID=A0A2M9BH68_9ACTN|nr:maleylpyruvate isomerase N-terminal domain-containing protein [Mumia flava]PJJ57288.1 uncharacterized protein (TIGR03083 family) [Mumia flava]
MTELLAVDRYAAQIRAAADLLASEAGRAGLATPVPTCPGWTVADLLAHQAMVHRWATGHLAGRPHDEPTEEEARSAAGADPVGYLLAGVDPLLDAIGEASDDLEAYVFLADPPPARIFWARRQCHETTVHAVDAVAAALGRTPRADEVALEADVAADGIDELLRGFLTRRPSRMFAGGDETIAVVPTDVPASWTIHVGERLAITAGADPDAADATFSGTVTALDLALWNRCDDLEVDGDPDLLRRWREAHRVTW